MAPREVDGNINVRLSILCTSSVLTAVWQRIIHLIVEKEGSLFTRKTSNALYNAILPSNNSSSEVTENQSWQLCSSLLLYRLVDAISFAENYGLNGGILPRHSFSKLYIPVSCVLQYSSFSS